LNICIIKYLCEKEFDADFKLNTDIKFFITFDNCEIRDVKINLFFIICVKGNGATKRSNIMIQCDTWLGKYL